jgi:hypothetical protein
LSGLTDPVGAPGTGPGLNWRNKLGSRARLETHPMEGQIEIEEKIR